MPGETSLPERMVLGALGGRLFACGWGKRRACSGRKAGPRPRAWRETPARPRAAPGAAQPVGAGRAASVCCWRTVMPPGAGHAIADTERGLLAIFDQAWAPPRAATPSTSSGCRCRWRTCTRARARVLKAWM